MGRPLCLPNHFQGLVICHVLNIQLGLHLRRALCIAWLRIIVSNCLQLLTRWNSNRRLCAKSGVRSAWMTQELLADITTSLSLNCPSVLAHMLTMNLEHLDPEAVVCQLVLRTFYPFHTLDVYRAMLAHKLSQHGPCVCIHWLARLVPLTHLNIYRAAQSCCPVG